jgi:hypothetical protein
MSVRVTIDGSPTSIEALAKFLQELESVYPDALYNANVIADQGVLYVRAEFCTDEENLEAGDRMAEVSVRIQEETGVLVVLAPRTRERKMRASLASGEAA